MENNDGRTNDKPSARMGDDNLSIKSSDSVTTSGEYEIVPEAPSLSEVENALKSKSLEAIIGLKLNNKEFVEMEGVEGNASSLKVDNVSNSPVLNMEGCLDISEMKKNLDDVIHELEGEEANACILADDDKNCE